MLGGVTVNLLLGIFIYSMVLFTWGDTYLPNENVENGVICSDFALDLGFQNGDKIISIDGNKVDRFLSISTDMVLRDESFNVEVERTGEVINIAIGDNFIKHWKNSGKKLLFNPRTSVEVESVIKDSESEKVGLENGDILVAVNGVETMFFDDFKHQLDVNKNNTVILSVIRGLDLKTIPVMVSENGTIGFQIANNLNVSKEEFSLLTSFPAGYNLAMKKLGEYIGQFALIFNSDNELAGEMGGFGAIGSMFPSTWDWQQFWNLTAFLSLMLAFMNLLPIPALDGGHVVFLIYEMVVGKPAPEKVMEYAQVVGMILLLSLLVFANGNDIVKLF